MKSTIFSRIITLAQVALCGALAACSGGSEPASEPAKTSPVTSSKPAASAATKAAQPSLVNAVSIGSAGQEIEVHFELNNRPEVGKSTDLKVRLLGLSEATELHLSVKADPKLELLGGAQAHFPSLKAGETLDHMVSLRGAATGIFVVDLQLVAMIDGEARTLSYAIPVAIVEPQRGAQEDAATAKAASGG